MQEDKTTSGASALVALHVFIPAEMRKRVKMASVESGRTMPEIVAEALERYFANRG